MYATHEKSSANSKFGDGDCDSCSNMATSNQKQDVDTNPMVDRINVSNLKDQSSSWGTPFLPSTAMPSNPMEGVTTIESWSKGDIIPKSGANSNSTVATNIKIIILGDKSSSWGTHLYQAMSCPLIRKRLLLQLNHPCSNAASIIPKPGVNSNPMIAKWASKSDCGRHVNFFGYTIFAKQCHVLQSEQWYYYN